MSRRPALWLVAVLTVVALALARWTSPWGIGAAALAVVLGWAVARGALAPTARPGVTWAVKAGLLVAITLVGFTMDVVALVRAGPNFLLVALAAVVTAWAVAQILGLAFGLEKPLRSLLGVGIGICGVVAMGATQKALGARDEDMAVATAIITVLGSIGLIALPLLQWSTGILPPEAFGAWAGGSLPAVSQAVGAGIAGAGLAAAATATAVKMARVALLVPVSMLLGFGARKKRAALPREVTLFVLAVLLGSVIPWPVGVTTTASEAARIALVAALAALGLLTRVQDVGNGRAWATATGAWLAVVAVTLLLV